MSKFEMTVADEIVGKCAGRDNDTFAELIRSEHLDDDAIDQDWEHEATVYTFGDGSKARASGGTVDVVEDSASATIATIADLQRSAAGGIVQTDRGNGSAGPLWLGEGIEDADVLETSCSLVTEEEDPEAWRLAREAFAALDLAGEPEFVAVGEEQHPGEHLDSNPHQAIYAV